MLATQGVTQDKTSEQTFAVKESVTLIKSANS
jgi:hypothetical protein